MSDILIAITFVTVMLSFLSSLITFEANRRQYNSLHNQAAHTLTLVNGQHSDMVKRVDQLTETLQTADIPIPANGKGGTEDAIHD
jgi:hypothetical protein